MTPSPSSPLLDKYNRDGVVTPSLQRAMDLARMSLTPPAPSLTMTGTDQPASPAGPAPRLAQPQQPMPSLSAPTPQTTELNRITAPPLATRTPSGEPNSLAHTRADTGLSGIGQIHSAAARVPLTILDAIGSTFLPALTQALPGTQLHHNQLVRQQEGLVNSQVRRDTETANQQRAAAESAELPARAEHEHAEAQALANPPQKEATNDLEAWQRQNPGKPVSDYWAAKATANAKPATEPKTPFEVWHKAHPDDDGTGWLKEEEKAKPGTTNEYTDFKAGYLEQHPGANKADIAKAFSLAKQAPERPPHALMVDPATGRAIEVGPGSQVPNGAMTTSGLSSTNVPTSTTRTMAETAPKVQELATRVSQLIDEQSKSLGPAASRWNEFMSGKVGAPNPEFTKLRTDVGLLQTALMRMHVGARGGGEMMEHFRNLIDVAKQSPENLKAALEEIQSYAKAVATEGKPGSAAPAGPAVRKYNPATGKLE